ncbi:hypothetical protein GUJ93_ZPchr0003g16835 [Zizania palustris]|uniref:Uncharacterized protein n=1 Tax=Zizania palustris TaxID=103762 RepID=A0A8J5SBV5_ZIZPA|nr:hypothetical protein GUJ93_ZPchr0003g16835 [Zizania palustris]
MVLRGVHLDGIYRIPAQGRRARQLAYGRPLAVGLGTEAQDATARTAPALALRIPARYGERKLRREHRARAPRGPPSLAWDHLSSTDPETSAWVGPASPTGSGEGETAADPGRIAARQVGPACQ